MRRVCAQVYVGDRQFLEAQICSMGVYLASYLRLVPVERRFRYVVAGGFDD